MYQSLSNYLARLEREGELARIRVPVDPVLEIAEITDRMSKSPGGGKALLFEKTLTGTDSGTGAAGISAFPVATNIFGSERRIAMALGADSPGEVSERLDGLLREALSPRGSLVEKMHALPLLAEASGWFPRKISERASSRAECRQTILRGDEARLSLLPALKCWPHDGGRFVTLPLVHTAHPETGARNVGMYRMQIFGDRTAGMHWHVHKTGARHYDAYKKAGIARMPVSVCLGGDPVYSYAATAPMPEGMDEYLLAGFLRRRPVRLVKCVTNEMWVPADCDIVIEGWVDTTEPLRTEGPFGDHTGFYSLEDPYPVFHVSAITHRRDAVYPATLVGIPPQEDAYFAEATERIFLPPIRRALQPEVLDLHMPPPGVAHNLAIVSVESSYAGQPEKVANALWGAGQMMFNKVLVAVPPAVDVRDYETIGRLMRNVDVSRDMVFGHGVLDVLDHATATPGVGGKLLIDLTRVADEPGKPAGEPVGKSADPNSTPAAPFEFLFDPAAEELAPHEKLWLGLADIDPTRDITIEEKRGDDGRIRKIAVIDCRAKLSGGDVPVRWPNVVAADETTIALVDERWKEYGLGELLPSPSRRYKKLLLPGGAEVEKTLSLH